MKTTVTLQQVLSVTTGSARRITGYKDRELNAGTGFCARGGPASRIAAALLVGSAFLAPFLAAPTAQAQSDGGLASIVIHNATRQTLNYQFRWGSDPWEKSKLRPFEFNVHYTQVDRRGYAPYRWIRFDSIGGDDQTTHKTYRLQFYRTDDPNRGKPYYLQWVRGKPSHLDLYKAVGNEESEYFRSFRYDYDRQKWGVTLPDSWLRHNRD